MRSAASFEDKVAVQTKTARHIWGIPNRYGRIPTAPVAVEIPDTGLALLIARREPGGEIRLQDFVTETKSETRNEHSRWILKRA